MLVDVARTGTFDDRWRDFCSAHFVVNNTSRIRNIKPYDLRLIKKICAACNVPMFEWFMENHLPFEARIENLFVFWNMRWEKRYSTCGSHFKMLKSLCSYTDRRRSEKSEGHLYKFAFVYEDDAENLPLVNWLEDQGFAFDANLIDKGLNDECILGNASCCIALVRWILERVERGATVLDSMIEHASYKGMLDVVMLFHEAGWRIDPTIEALGNDDAETIRWASKAGFDRKNKQAESYAKAVKLRLSKESVDALLSTSDGRLEIAFHQFASNGRADLLEYLKARQPPPFEPAFHYALQKNSLVTVRWLFENGYIDKTAQSYSSSDKKIVAWLKKRRISCMHEPMSN
jgi:hypothetical protein